MYDKKYFLWTLIFFLIFLFIFVWNKKLSLSFSQLDEESNIELFMNDNINIFPIDQKTKTYLEFKDSNTLPTLLPSVEKNPYLEWDGLKPILKNFETTHLPFTTNDFITKNYYDPLNLQTMLNKNKSNFPILENSNKNNIGGLFTFTKDNQIYYWNYEPNRSFKSQILNITKENPNVSKGLYLTIEPIFNKNAFSNYFYKITLQDIKEKHKLWLTVSPQGKLSFQKINKELGQLWTFIPAYDEFKVEFTNYGTNGQIHFNITTLDGQKLLNEIQKYNYKCEFVYNNIIFNINQNWGTYGNFQKLNIQKNGQDVLLSDIFGSENSNGGTFTIKIGQNLDGNTFQGFILNQNYSMENPFYLISNEKHKNLEAMNLNIYDPNKNIPPLNIPSSIFYKWNWISIPLQNIKESFMNINFSNTMQSKFENGWRPYYADMLQGYYFMPLKNIDQIQNYSLANAIQLDFTQTIDDKITSGNKITGRGLFKMPEYLLNKTKNWTTYYWTQNDLNKINTGIDQKTVCESYPNQIFTRGKDNNKNYPGCNPGAWCCKDVSGESFVAYQIRAISRNILVGYKIKDYQKYLEEYQKYQNKNSGDGTNNLSNLFDFKNQVYIEWINIPTYDQLKINVQPQLKISINILNKDKKMAIESIPVNIDKTYLNFTALKLNDNILVGNYQNSNNQFMNFDSYYQLTNLQANKNNISTSLLNIKPPSSYTQLIYPLQVPEKIWYYCTNDGKVYYYNKNLTELNKNNWYILPGDIKNAENDDISGIICLIQDKYKKNKWYGIDSTTYQVYEREDLIRGIWKLIPNTKNVKKIRQIHNGTFIAIGTDNNIYTREDLYSGEWILLSGNNPCCYQDIQQTSDYKNYILVGTNGKIYMKFKNLNEPIKNMLDNGWVNCISFNQDSDLIGGNGSNMYKKIMTNYETTYNKGWSYILPFNVSNVVDIYYGSPFQINPEVFGVGPSYQYNRQEAKQKCESLGATLASSSQVEQAQKNGADWCFTGQVLDGNYAMYPITTSTQGGCGNGSAGIKTYLTSNDKAGANCFGFKPPKSVVSEIFPFNGSRYSEYF